MNNNLAQTIESILFATAESYTISSLAKLVQVSTAEVETALSMLSEQLEGHAMMPVRLKLRLN
jgi:chromosome segregation and condensation protein ScpB